VCRWLLGLGLVTACTAPAPDRVSATTEPGDPPEVPIPEVVQTSDDPPRTDCAALGLPVEPWWTLGHGRSIDPGARAGDVVLSTTRGTFDLAADWSGCEVLLVLPDAPLQEDTNLWSEAALAELLEALPEHVLLVIGSRFGDPSWVDDAAGWAASLDDERLWVADQPLAEAPGWLGEAMTQFGWGFGVDRQQQIRYVGSFADVARYNASVGWWDGTLSMAALEVVHWEFEAERQARLDAEDVDEIDLFTRQVVEDPGWAGERSTTTVQLPDDLSAYDTLEADLHLGCVGEGELGLCPPWDYLVHLYLCAPGEEVCSIEVGRWISTYHREGRWVHDLTPLLPLLEGGSTTFQFYSQQPYEVDLSLRLSTRGTPRPIAALPLHGGAWLDGSLGERPPVEVQIPAEAGRIELASVISGHGQAGFLNCAEFCVLDNVFRFDDHAVVIDYPIAGTEQGCELDVGNGTVPNQYGTWWFGRQGWCPGKEVPVERHDLTDQLDPGTVVSVDYEVLYNDQPYTNASARMDVSSWLVVYE